ncbi:MAG: acyltransferase [Eubacteriales bacterium]|nr:acyltransferase [Eubacteriales bacterium]
MKQNEKILLTSFIFTIFVVWLHAGEPLLSYVPGQVAVPGFFMLSGYLFMKGIPSDSAAAEKEAVTGKLKRRVNTLVIPYLLWNAIYFVIYLVTGRAQIGEIFEAVFLYRCNPVFWYMFQLILITVLAPAVYYIMKKGRAAALILLAVIFTLAVLYAKLPFHYCNEDALFYYCLGGYFMMRGTYGDRHSSTMGTYLPFALTAAATAAFLLVRSVLPADLRNISEVGYRAAGALAVYFLTELVYEKKGGIEVRPWMKVNFFVYATHYMIIRIIWALETAAGLNGYQTANIITYLVMPAICVSAAYGLSVIMKKYVPKVYSALTGGR